MNTYAIGSVNGCYQSLMNLLEKIQFDAENDRLWFTGNLINDRTESLAVLRFVHSLGKKAVLVLGNQELRLLQLVDGFVSAQANDFLTAIQNAPDRDVLLKGLRRRPLIHHDSTLNFTLVHAGIPAEWSFSQALTFAYEVESVLSQTNGKLLLENLAQDQSRWHAKLRGWKRQRFIVNACTLMKYCTPEGKLDFQTSGSVHTQTDDLLPWYRVPNRMTTQLNIIFSDEADFQDDEFSGIYPLSAQENLTALKLAAIPETISVIRVEPINNATIVKYATMNIEQNNIDSIAELSQFITQQKSLLKKQYEHLLVQDLTQRQWDGCFQRNVLIVVQQFYQDALTQIKTLSLDASTSSVNRGLSELTKQVLQVFDSFVDEFLLFVVDKHRTSCALSNFPDEHKPDKSYVNIVRKEIAALWQDFALEVNGHFLDSAE